MDGVLPNFSPQGKASEILNVWPIAPERLVANLGAKW